MPSKRNRSHRAQKLSRRQQSWLDAQQVQLSTLRQQIKADLANVTAQVEASLNLHSVLSGGQGLPPMHGWPVSPDFALMLVQRVLHEDYDLIIEFGSGTSTVLMAQALRMKMQRSSGKTVYLAFEHLQPYLVQTQGQLQQQSLLPLVQLHLAGLQPYVAASGNTYPYYDCRAVLAESVRGIPSGARVLVVVDGPPASTGEHARWPAYEVVSQLFASHGQGAQIEFLLDDYIRQDEQEIAASWEQMATDSGWLFSATRHRLEKDAYLLQIQIPKM